MGQKGLNEACGLPVGHPPKLAGLDINNTHNFQVGPGETIATKLSR